MRGEDQSHDLSSVRPNGSPPHAWGRHREYRQMVRRYRFTPTCVGKTVGAYAPNTINAVHPHMRGEDCIRDAVVGNIDGSPPHAWGRLNEEAWHATGCRFTPTCVGKTAQANGRQSAGTVHPHMRGEDLVALINAAASAGSPPHAWGRLRSQSQHSTRKRFTPTCVGKTPLHSQNWVVMTVHPHMRGEDYP